MLLAGIDFKFQGKSTKFKGYLSDNYQSTLVRLVAQDGDSADLLLQGFASDLGKMYRTATFGSAKVEVERLFKKGERFDSEGVDVSQPAYFKKSPVFALYAYLYAVVSYAKTIQSSVVNKVEVALLGKEHYESVDQSIRDTFETPFGKGYVVRRLGSIRELAFATQDTSKSVQLSVSMVSDDDFEFLPKFDKVKQMGSEVLSMDSRGTAYRVELDRNFRNRLLGLPESSSEGVSLKGVTTSTHSPFYQTVEDVIKAEGIRAQAGNRQARDFEWIKEKVKSGKYKVVKPEEVEEVFRQLEEDYKRTKLVGFDTETDGLDFTFRCWYGFGSQMVGAVLSAKPGTSYYFPVKHKNFPNVCKGDTEYFVEKYLQPFMDGKRVVCHNNFFDWKVGYRHGLVYDCYFDTMVFMRKTFSARDNLRYGLKDTTEHFLERTAPELDDLARNGDYNTCGGTFDELNEELVSFYACPDADNTLSLALYFIENGYAGKSGFDIMQAVVNDSRFSCVASYSEFYGMHLNMESVPELREHYGRILVEQYRDLIEFLAVSIPPTVAPSENIEIKTDMVAGLVESERHRPFNERAFKFQVHQLPRLVTTSKGWTIGSTAKNVEFAYTRLGYPEQIAKKSGNLALDKSAIKTLSKAYKPNVEPFTVSSEDLVERLSKLLAGFLDVKTVTDFKAVEDNKNQLAFVRCLARLVRFIQEGSPFGKWEVETLRIATKYLFGEQFGFKTTLVETDEKGIFLVAPEKDAPLYPFASLLKKTRDTNRLFTSFLDKISDYFTEDGFCFPKIDAFKVTGRLSTSKPNIQGFDDTIKKEITARDGYYMVDTDYASKENRVIAIMSKEQALIEMFKDWRNDYHRFQSARLNGLLQEQVTDDLRKQSKGLVFGINFGMSDASLGEILFGSRSPENTRKAQERRALFFSFQRSVESWFENNVDLALRKGYSETIFGSKRFYDRSKVSRSQIRRYALNHPIQGSAADIYKKGMVDLFSDLKELGYLGKILLTGFIHDEATVEVHKSIHPHNVLGLIRKNLMVEIEGGCPLDLGFGVGHSWYTAKKTEWQVGLQEELEWNTGIYDWAGDIDKFMSWAEAKIHDFNAVDPERYLNSVSFAETATDAERVFPVNYGLELNKYLLGEMTKGEESYKLAEQVVELPDGVASMSLGERKGFFYTLFSDLHIHKRLRLFHLLRGSFPEEVIQEFVDLSEVDTGSQSAESVSEEQEREEALRRQLELLTEQVIDFGLKLNPSGEVLFLLYHVDFYRFVKRLCVPVDSVQDQEGYLRLVFYNMEKDATAEITNVVLPASALPMVSAEVKKYVI